MPRRRHPLEVEGDVLIHPGKMSSFPEWPQQKAAVPMPSRLSARFPPSEQRTPCMPSSRGCPMAPCCPRRWRSATPTLPAMLHAVPCLLPYLCPLPSLPSPVSGCVSALTVHLPLACGHHSCPVLWDPASGAARSSPPPTRAGSFLILSPSDTCPPCLFCHLGTSLDPCSLSTQVTTPVQCAHLWFFGPSQLCSECQSEPSCHAATLLSPISSSCVCYPDLPWVGIYWRQSRDLQSGGVCQSFSCVCLFATPWTVAGQVPLSMEFCRQEHWSGLPFPSPGHLPDPGLKLASPTLKADCLPTYCQAVYCYTNSVTEIFILSKRHQFCSSKPWFNNPCPAKVLSLSVFPGQCYNGPCLVCACTCRDILM